MPGPNPAPPDGGGQKAFPGFMRTAHDDGFTRVLLMRGKTVSSESDENGTKVLPLPANPFLISLSVERFVGRENIKHISASREARGSRYVIRTRSEILYKKLLDMKFLSDGSQVEVISHPSLNVVQGVVYEPDTIEFKEEDLLQLLQPQGITNVRRIKKRVGKVLKNTPLLVLNITGTVLPTHVFFGLLRVGVRQYYPTPMICRVCAQYGHIGKNCPNSEKPICLNCSANFHTTEDETCAKAAFCLHCKAGHSPMSKVCPKYQEEDEVIHLRIDKGLSFAEARKALADSKRSTTYAQELQNNLMEQKDKQIAELQRQLNDMRAQMKALCSSTGTVITRQRSRSRKPSPMLSKQHEKMPVTKTTDIREMDFENGRSKRQITTKYSCEGNSKKASYSQANKNDSNNEQIDVSETEHESDNDQFFRPRNGKITKNYHSTTR